MKKGIVVLCIFIFIASSAYAETKSQNFFIEFNKSLPLTLVFYNPDVDGNPTSDNPPEPISSISFTSNQYGIESERKRFGIFWDLDVNTILGSTNASSLNIDLHFYAESSIAESFGYMLRSEYDREKGLNYHVVYDDRMPGSASLVDGIIDTKDPTIPLELTDRTINLARGVEDRTRKIDWYVFEMYVPSFTSTTLPLGGYSGNIAIVLTTN